MNNTIIPPLFNSTTVRHSAGTPNRIFYQNLQRYVYGYTMITVCGAGILGNILAFTVLSRKSMRSSNTATYLRCLAAVDACVLVLAILRYRSYYVLLSEKHVIDMVLTFDPYVQVYITPLFWVALGVSSFVTLSLSFERYLAIRWPLTLKQRCTKVMVRVCIVLIITVVLLVTFPHFLCYQLKKTQFGNTNVVAIKLITTYLDAHAYLHAYSYYILPIMWYMVPWLMVTVFNVLLSIQVKKTSHIRVGIPTLVNLNRNLSILIILIVGMYMVCHFPRCILAFYCLVNYCSASDMGEDVNTKSYYIFIAAADTLNILNSCLNIVVYCMTGSRFRHEVKRLLLCRSFCWQSATQPTVQSLHVSLKEVPATPMDDRKSFNMSYKDLRLAHSNFPSPSQSLVDLQHANNRLFNEDCYNVIHSNLVLSPNRPGKHLLSASSAGSATRKISILPQPSDQAYGGEASDGASAARPVTNVVRPANPDDKLMPPHPFQLQPIHLHDPPAGRAEITDRMTTLKSTTHEPETQTHTAVQAETMATDSEVTAPVTEPTQITAANSMPIEPQITVTNLG